MQIKQGYNKNLIQFTLQINGTFSLFPFGVDFVLKIKENVCFLNRNLTQTKTLSRRELIYSYSLNVSRKNSELADETMNTGIYERKTFMRRIQFILEFFKKIFSHSPSSTAVTVFLIAGKLLGQWLWNFKTFSLFLWIVLWKIECNCMRGLFLIGDLSVVG